MIGDVSMSRSSGHDVAAVLARLDEAHAAAWDEVAGLCDGSRRWTMRVPVDEARDSDTVIATALTGGEKAAAALRAVLEICAAWEEEARQWLDQAARNEAVGFGMAAAAQRENASDALLRADHVRSAVVAALGVETTEAGQ
jgi:hypothetical protein